MNARKRKSMHNKSNIFSLIDKTNARGCWLWKGYIDPRYGYGRYGNRKNRKQAHRLVYELLHAKIPDGLFLDHLCRVRHCVNPEHLEPVTKRTNTLRGIGFPALNSRKTHCPKGHPYDIAYGKHKTRGCSKCKNDLNREWMRGYLVRNREAINLRKRLLRKRKDALHPYIKKIGGIHEATA